MRYLNVTLFALALGLTACGGGGGGGATPLAPGAPPPTPGATPTPVPPSAAGWRITIYYTAVAKYYSGAPKTVTGCSNLQCTTPNATLGTFPSDFVQTVMTEGTGKIADNQYLNWSANVGYWLDVVPRDAQGHALMPYRSAAADLSVPFGTTLKLQSCGADTVTHTPTDSATCSALSRSTWVVSDRFTAGTVGQHVDLYVGEQTSANFTSSAIFIDASGASLTTAPGVATGWKPTPSDSYQWILSTALDTSSGASVYDVDGFNTTAANVSTLHSIGRRAVCYVNVGAYENFRSDASSFPSSVIGNAYAGWPGENWLDIRRVDLLTPIMQARFDLCKSKGFDAVEPDNIDGYETATGFPLTAADQLVYNTWVASLAHERGLSIALKNDGAQVGELQSLYDFALTEDCWKQGWCAQLAPFRAANKAVFNAEYTDVSTPATFTGTYCPQAQAAGFYAFLKNRQLDAWVQHC